MSYDAGQAPGRHQQQVPGSPGDPTMPQSGGGSTGVAYGVTPGMNRLGDHWALVLTYGILTFALGLILAVWPDETLKVVAVLIGLQFLVSGVIRLVSAFAASGLDGSVRALMGLSGALALIVGLLCLRDPLQTLLAIGLILGVWWVVSGIVDIMGAIFSPTPGRRGWDVAAGVVSLLAGGFLLANPTTSLGLLVVVLCAWMFLIGFMAIVTGLRLRAEHRSPAPRAAGGAPAPAV